MIPHVNYTSGRTGLQSAFQAFSHSILMQIDHFCPVLQLARLGLRELKLLTHGYSF